MFKKDVLKATMPMMKVIADGIVHVAGPSGAYFRPALNSVDHDVGMLNEVVEIFLVQLFGNAPE